MLYVGIDVAKNKHDVTALNVPGKTVLKPLTFSNNKAGFELLDLSLRQLNQDCLIALKLLSDPNREQFQHDNRQVDLKILARHIHRLKKKQSDWKVQYTRCLDIIFPELDKIVGKHSEYTYQLLTRYPNPQKRIEAGFDKLIEIKRLTASNSIAFCRALKSSPNHQIEIRNSLDKTIDFSYSLSFS
ncbi:pilin gene inverting-like protein [Streptococcus pneumoniae]|nr:pilin gene inverting-like protein [Streptococcus pneumoniae]CVO57797.1 pilin gene inverting-like protein [Streptococcus pneumoniae]CVO77097.1 pilin gene inverting-like protein [Streptococcus pneumoniae]CVT18969.1 pilin gene inverting-like protein [Streptococcus pneumoniae]CVW08170.1 pilin gene inverting-like protein [Streptococcus pneumoniae]